MKKPSEFHRPEIAALVRERTKGNLAYRKKLLVDSAKEAIVTGQERIDAALLESNACEIPTVVIQAHVR